MLAQEYGQAYYHLLVENISRITVVRDLLLEHPDIKVQLFQLFPGRNGLQLLVDLSSCKYELLT